MKEREEERTLGFKLKNSSVSAKLLVPLLQDLLQNAERGTFPHTSALWSSARVQSSRLESWEVRIWGGSGSKLGQAFPGRPARLASLPVAEHPPQSSHLPPPRLKSLPCL